MAFKSQDPYSGLELASYEHASEGQVLQSIDLLSSAFDAWRALPVVDRQRALLQVAARIEKRKESLAALITTEMGKPLVESLAELNKCKTTIERACAADLSFLNSREVQGMRLSEVRTEPRGIVYSIMPWNYPFWQVIRMAVPALLAGNTILLKHSEITPGCAVAIHELFADVFTGPVLINNFISHDLTDFVLRNHAVGGVSLTGSVKAGQIVYKTAAAYFKRVVLELGGCDPYIVCADADLGLAAKKITKGRLLNCGQSCISAKRAIVHSSVKDNFLELLKSEFAGYDFGDPSAATTALGPLAHPRFKAALEEQLKLLLLKTDAKLVYTKPHGQNAAAAFVDAQIYELTSASDWLKNQEFFGPVLLVHPFKSDDEAVKIANSTDFGLGGGVFSKTKSKAQALAARIEAGQVGINEIIVSDLSLPFGGVKFSGIGRELGRESYFEFTQTKVITGI